MCRSCWLAAGSPDERPPEMDRLIGLIRALYEIHPTGGPLHAVLDDWNLDGKIAPWYKGWSADDLDELYYRGWPLAELDLTAPAIRDGLGVSTRGLCDEIATLLNAMTEAQRNATLGHWMGYPDRDTGPTEAVT